MFRTSTRGVEDKRGTYRGAWLGAQAFVRKQSLNDASQRVAAMAHGKSAA